MKRLSGSVQTQFKLNSLVGKDHRDSLLSQTDVFFNALNIYLFLVYVAPYNAANYKTVH